MTADCNLTSPWFNTLNPAKVISGDVDIQNSLLQIRYSENATGLILQWVMHFLARIPFININLESLTMVLHPLFGKQITFMDCQWWKASSTA